MSTWTIACVKVVVRVSLLFSPRPAVLLVRRVFSAGGAATARSLARHAPPGVVAIRDERYGATAESLLDVYRPAGADGALPTVVWVHGGGWVAGSKEELAGYLALVASHGYTVVAPRYGLAPEHRHPAPARQTMEALGHLQSNAERLGVDPARFVLAGDSAGAQIAAQAAALVTTPGYAEAVGVTPTITGEQLRGVVLACGPYDMALLAASAADTPAGGLVNAVLRAYSGNRHFQSDRHFATASVADHVTPAFPPALVTVGDADPLRSHSELLVERLRGAGVPVDALLFPAGHTPPLGHEYQFDLDSDAGRAFLERLLSFLARLS